MQQFQPSSGWDVDLQNMYNVGFDQGRSSNAFSSQPYTGKDKIELCSQLSFFFFFLFFLLRLENEIQSNVECGYLKLMIETFLWSPLSINYFFSFKKCMIISFKKKNYSTIE